MEWIGVDYGSKLTGTTVICYLENSKLHFKQSAKKEDADKWLLHHINNWNPKKIFLDAPLSLPNAFYGKGDNYFYRLCDKETKAMSPMFIGGLTARAIKLKDALEGISLYETYPAYLIKNVLCWKEDYNKKSKISHEVINKITSVLPFTFQSNPINWHQFDAALCWISGYRHSKGTSIQIGEIDEGVIYV